MVRCQTLQRGAIRIEEDGVRLPCLDEPPPLGPAVTRDGDRVRLVFHVPARGLLGFTSSIAMATRGRAVVTHIFLEQRPHAGALGGEDGAPNYVMLHNNPMQPGAVSHADTGGHTHEWEHVVYVLEGTATLVCGGKNYTVSEGDAILVPPNEHHQWKNESHAPLIRVTYNPVASETAEQ